MRRAWPGAAACAAILGAASGGPARAQSPFSLVNLGQPAAAGDARVLGRGGWGFAENDTLAPSLRNPAGLPGLRQVAIVIAGYADAINSRGVDGDRANRRVMTPDLAVALPFADGRGTIAAGFHARRSTQYASERPRAWLAGADTLATGSEVFEREGTQFAIPFLAAWRLNGRLSIAAGLNLERGLIRERAKNIYTDVRDSLGAFRASSLTRSDDLTGSSASFSALLRPAPGVMVGAVYTTPWTYDVARSLEVVNLAGTADSSYTLRMPAAWGVGASARLAPRWRAGADFERRDFRRLRGRPDWEGATTAEWTLALGCERELARVRRGGLRNLPLRFGASVGQWGYEVGGNPIREWRVSAGTGFAFQSGGGRVDVALSYGRVGDRERNGYADGVWRLGLSLAGLERWW